MRSHCRPRRFSSLLAWSLMLSLVVNAALKVSATKQQSTPPQINTTNSSSTTVTTGDIDGDSYVLTTETYTATRKTFVRGPPPDDIAALAAAHIAATATSNLSAPGAASAGAQQQPLLAGQPPQPTATSRTTTSSNGASGPVGNDSLLDYSFTAEVTGSPQLQSKSKAAEAPAKITTTSTSAGSAARTSNPSVTTKAANKTGSTAAPKPASTVALSSTRPSVVQPTTVESVTLPVKSESALVKSASVAANPDANTAAVKTPAVAAKPGSNATAVKPGAVPIKPGLNATAVKPGSSGIAAGPRTGGTVPHDDKKWKPKYPFPQCLDNTLTYDVSFVGALRFIQVGSVRYGYHRFGPLRPDLLKLLIANPPAGLLSSEEKKVPAPVIFMSGWGMTMYMWPIPLLQKLAETREVIIFDSMRTGFSTDNSTAPLSIPMMANSTAALITALGLKQPDIWSWSVGAFIGYGLLAFHQNKIGNVIIASGSPGGPDALLPPEPVTQQIATIQQNYTAMLPYLFPEGVKAEGVCAFYAAYNSFYSSQYTQLQTPLGTSSLLDQGAAVVKFFKDPTIINLLAGTPNRVLILHGVQDKLMPVRNALLGAWKLLGAWMLQFPGEGHGLPFSNVQAVIMMTLQFFSFASPLGRAELNQWSVYGGTAVSRTQQQNVTLVVRAEPVKM